MKKKIFRTGKIKQLKRLFVILLCIIMVVEPSMSTVASGYSDILVSNENDIEFDELESTFETIDKDTDEADRPNSPVLPPENPPCTHPQWDNYSSSHHRCPYCWTLGSHSFVAMGCTLAKCSKCTARVSISNHDEVYGGYYQKPTCSYEGIIKYTCKKCGMDVRYKNVPKLPHTFGADGRCTDCNEPDPSYIPPTPSPTQPTNPAPTQPTEPEPTPEPTPQPEKWCVTFEPQGGNVSPPYYAVENGNSCDNFPVPTRAGYSFEGWYNSSGERKQSLSSVTSNITLYAHWKQDASASGTATEPDTGNI